ncbi:aminotransferase DegT [Candidatus Saganbacteria bacterium CG08_land_8_20_14_0_20_45_16]|uniref:Aminotransferase DegT n=1 Tax=Candidatus Saganbacteria bacterium CG08_land_8_20_14_0_20_45_16 TaxID=2014293 RepID=A0A2H0XZ67_UNCSA|nr:MAG: aminotransferase DegT [Candidatus Saganbacteria bacterium CG08_land_8_20_14_0_20_45_16]
MIPVAVPSIGEKELEYVTDAVKSGWVSSQGKYVYKFEKKYAKYCGTKYASSVANGTVALHLALKVLGIGNGDEVIIPALAYIAVANAVVYTGAKPVLVDSQDSTWCIDPDKIEEKINKNTKAIIPVHIYGHAADMDPILALAKKHELFVIEDAAEAHGAEYKGKKVGSLGDIGVFSFYGNKIITTGEGGMLTTNNQDYYERAQFLKSQAMSKTERYVHPEIGFNYRLTNIQSAIGLAQLEQLDLFIEKKRRIAKKYNQLLAGIKGISLPPEADWCKSIFWMYSILVDKEYRMDRDTLMGQLFDKGVETRPFFPCVHNQPPHRQSLDAPVAEGLSVRGINLPTSVSLKDDEIEYICSVIRKK